MSLYIPKVKLPPDDKYKFDLVLHISYDGTVRSPWGYLITDGKAIEVPEHGDLIDRALLSAFCYDDSDIGVDDFDHGVLFTLEAIDKLPVVIPEEADT